MSFKISYIYEAVDKFTGTGSKINRSLKKTERLVHRLSGRFRTLAKDARKGINKRGFLGGALTGASVILGFRKLISVGTKFEDSLADLQAITGAAGKDLRFLSDEAFVLGKQFATSGSEVLTAFKLVASAKPELLENIPALRQVTKEVLLLKNAAGIELADAALIVGRSLNQFGKGAEFANKFVNVLAAGAKLGSSEVTDTAVALINSAVSARSAGADFEQLNAVIQVLATRGIKAEKAGTALRKVFSVLEIKGVMDDTRGLNEALDVLANVNLSAAQIAKLFGEEAKDAASVLVQERREVARLSAALRGTNIAQDQANIRLKTFSARLRRIGTLLEQKVVGLFTRLAPKILEVANNFGAFLDGIDTADLDSMVLVLTSILDLVTAIGKITGGFVNLGKFLGEDIARTVTLLSGDADLVRNLEQPDPFIAEKNRRMDINLTLKGNTDAVSKVESRTDDTTRLNVGRNLAFGGA